MRARIECCKASVTPKLDVTECTIWIKRMDILTPKLGAVVSSPRVDLKIFRNSKKKKEKKGEKKKEKTLFSQINYHNDESQNTVK